MFRSQAMSRIELAIPRQDVVAVTEALATSGVFHLTPSEHPADITPDQGGEDWHQRAAAFAALEQRTLVVMEALCVEECSPPVDTPHHVEPEVAEMEVEHLEQEAQIPLRELEEEQLRLSELGRALSQLETVVDLDVDLDTVRNLRYLFALLGAMPIENIGRLRSSLGHVPYELIELRREGHLATVLLVGTRRDAEILNRAARSAYLNPLKLPETYRGTPAQAIEALRAAIKRTSLRIAECHTAIDKLHETRIRRLHHLLWRIRATHNLAETIAHYGQLRFTYLVSGWVPTSQMDRFRQIVGLASGDVQIEEDTPDIKDQADIPSALDSPPILKAFQGLVTNFGHPKYGEANPTLVVALTCSLPITTAWNVSLVPRSIRLSSTWWLTMTCTGTTQAACTLIIRRSILSWPRAVTSSPARKRSTT